MSRTKVGVKRNMDESLRVARSRRSRFRIGTRRLWGGEGGRERESKGDDVKDKEKKGQGKEERDKE